MKKNFFIYIMLLLCGCISCSKDKSGNLEKTTAKDLLQDEPDVQLVSYNVGTRTTKTMLSFKSFKAHQAIKDNLEAELEEHEEWFLSKYGHLDDDVQDSIADAIGFVYEQPLIDFEQSLGFTNTMRESYEAAMEAWLENGLSVVGQFEYEGHNTFMTLSW